MTSSFNRVHITSLIKLFAFSNFRRQQSFICVPLRATSPAVHSSANLKGDQGNDYFMFDSILRNLPNRNNPGDFDRPAVGPCAVAGLSWSTEC